VTLVHDGPEVHYANTVSVESAAEMLAAVEGAAPDADALISAAAISDYTVKKADTKLRSGEPRTLDLEPTPKILDSIRQAHPNLMMVGFKAETTGNEEAMVDQAAALRDRVDLAFVVANDASVMGSEETRALLVGPGAESPADCETVEGSKQQLGDRVARQLAERLSGSTDA